MSEAFDDPQVHVEKTVVDLVSDAYELWRIASDPKRLPDIVANQELLAEAWSYLFGIRELIRTKEAA